jgi:hypothetical protein
MAACIATVLDVLQIGANLVNDYPTLDLVSI